jgi:hypothetical protein
MFNEVCQIISCILILVLVMLCTVTAYKTKNLTSYFISSGQIYFCFYMLNSIFTHDFNPYFNEIKCDQSNNIFPFTISTFSVIYIYLLLNFLSLFYSNSFFIYSTPYSKCSCFFDNYVLLVNFILHLSSGLVKELYKEIFFFD